MGFALLRMKSLYDHLGKLARANPERPALLICDASGKIVETVSRTRLLQKIEEAASYLESLGLHTGDRIALDLDTGANTLVVSWAAWAMGIVTVPLDSKRDTPELRAFKLKSSGAHQIITEIPPTPTRPLTWKPDTSHEALVLFTSGTTAHPKGAWLTLENLIVNAKGIIEWLQIHEDDRFLVELPLHHINSTTFCLASLIAGASIAVPPRYSNSQFFEHAASSGATFTSLVPSIVFDQLSRTKEFEAAKDRLKLNRIQLGSAPVVAKDALEFLEKFSIPLYQGYGQTETALRVTGIPIDLPKATYHKLVEENSIGVPLAWANVEVADGEGRILGEGQEGELVVKGQAVMQGYLEGEPAFRDGYFLTGDIGYWKMIEGQRFFFLKGRSKEIIIKGGVNLSPVAIENALKIVDPDIDQVFVVGVPDKRYGEEVGACVVWRDGINQQSALRKLKLLLAAGTDKLSPYETPAFVVTVEASAIPKTSTGKVQRSVLKNTVTLEPLEDLFVTPAFVFKILSVQSPWFKPSFELYNHCWQPLTKNESEYKKYFDSYLTLGAIDTSGTLVGQLSFSYSDKKISCVSICSATYKPKPIPQVNDVPTLEFVREYLLAEHDPVMNFHHKLGAELVEVTPNGRPEDKSSLGYTMLLQYPRSNTLTLEGPVSSQLIQAARILAHDVGASLYAISRPGGLAAYLAKHVVESPA